MWFDHLMQLWKLSWTHWVVFSATWIITYLVVSAVLYSQYALWARDKFYHWIVNTLMVVSAIAGVCGGLLVLTGINAVFAWYTKPWGPPLPTALALDYQPFWMMFIIPVVVLGLWFVIEVHLIRNALENSNIKFPENNV
jgi:hypothetical protein